jgi:WD40 repeat protein
VDAVRETGPVLGAHEGAIGEIDVSPDGERFTTPSEDGTARVWRADGPPVVLRGHSGPVRSARFSPDGARS